MLGKLAVRNVKRSAKDYVIYFITVVLAFSFLFAFNLLGSSSEVLELSDVMNNFAIVMHVVNIFILFVVCFLINYTIKFMFSKRSLEFGTYLLLGIKKKQISNLFTLENVLLGLLTIPLAIFVGYILSLLVSFIITGLFCCCKFCDKFSIFNKSFSLLFNKSPSMNFKSVVISK